MLEIRTHLNAKGISLTPAQTIEFVIGVWNTDLPSPMAAMQVMSLVNVKQDLYRINRIASIRLKMMYLKSDQKLGLPKAGFAIAVSQMIYSYYCSIVVPEAATTTKFLTQLSSFESAYEKVTREIVSEQTRGNRATRKASKDKYEDKTKYPKR